MAGEIHPLVTQAHKISESQTTSTTMSSTRRVTINETLEVYEIISIYDYTACEISASWYNQIEMSKITERCFRIINKFESGVVPKNGQKYCMRGLEGHTRLGLISKQNNRADAYAAVLGEQEMGASVQTISDAYKCTSRSVQMWAQVVGARDERAVEAYLYDEQEEEEAETAPITPPLLESTSSKVLSAESPTKRRVSGTKAAFSPSARAA